MSRDDFGCEHEHLCVQRGLGRLPCVVFARETPSARAVLAIFVPGLTRTLSRPILHMV